MSYSYSRSDKNDLGFKTLVKIVFQWHRPKAEFYPMLKLDISSSGFGLAKYALSRQSQIDNLVIG
jgi:hypothetical protein